MGSKVKALYIVCLILVLSVFVGAVTATPTLRLDFYKDNGYGMGEDLQGQWTVNTEISSDVVRIEFYLDGQLQKNDTSAPFSWSFNTANFTEAQHTFKVVA
jgi:hypothetical protein